MCGVCGFYDGRLDSTEQFATLHKMLEAIGHRGPDFRGDYYSGPLALGHNRLAILDLNKESNQPMQKHGCQIVFNGEIYNYIELRKEFEREGYQFTTNSDTEVILVAYQKHGRDCVRFFVGMWAFAIWDESKQELFCSRDRFGIKPFYYIAQGTRFYFGSEYKALYPSALFTDTLNLEQVNRGLQLGWNAWHDESYYKCLRSLPPAHNLVFKPDGSLELIRFWDIHPERTVTMSMVEASSEFQRLFVNSVKLHMRSDVEVGACLSGGLDSSAIASVIGKEFSSTRLKTFTVYYEGRNEVDERPWVSEVLNAYPNLDPSYFSPSDDEIAGSFAKAIWHADVPLAGSSPISQYFVMQLAAKSGIKVLLDGQGSDEMLAGYMHSFYRLMGGHLSAMRLRAAISELNAHSRRQGFGMKKKADLFAKSLLAGFKSEQDLYAFEYRHYFPLLTNKGGVPFQLQDKPGSRLNRFLFQLMTATSLPSLLQFEDRNSMAFSIESRVPFLDHRLVEFVFSLNDDAKFSSGITKRVLREGMAGILPDAIAARSDKKGFVTPGEVKWLRGPLRFLLEQDFSTLEFLNVDRTMQVVREFKSGENRNANLVWRLAVLKYWMDNGRIPV